jgi:hypothetical protein
MIIRPLAALAKLVHAKDLSELPLAEDPWVDWSAQEFVFQKRSLILLFNTRSFYSVLSSAKDIDDMHSLSVHILATLRDYLKKDGFAEMVEKHLKPATQAMVFAKPLSRSVTASMADQMNRAKWKMEKAKISLAGISHLLNDVPLKSLEFRSPREVLGELGRTL